MSYKVGIVGATGAVGQELIELLISRGFPCAGLRCLASARSAGKELTIGEHTFTIKEAEPEAFEGLDFAIFSAGGDISKALAPEAVKRGCLVIDNSSAFRMQSDVPLVVPEINGDACRINQGIIANPNCTTAISLMGLYPLHQLFGLKRFFASTYQAVSGSGAEGIAELNQQVHDFVAGNEMQPNVYPYPIAFNLLPHVDSFLEDGYTKEEMKMYNETRKIMNLPEIKVSTTCVRVPIFRAHSVSIQAEFKKPVNLEAAREAISNFEGAELVDDPSANLYPMPAYYSGKEACGVGRLRIDSALENGLSLWVVGDQLWKGAALNAVQIAEWMHANGCLKKNS